ncbi:DeoR/GlpR family DNA-binding transcription regulator [Tepidanaerobacter syntrophicus]|uniref:DeoR family transcriptional regulator, fructose operon transcriptional repressor n=1 Tax=Tepidanaerobacter syntrophicus TaxID=224999 RepID=A0A0U9HE10_9FIRM|nr:DeoR/GlpR family DNA-binding transcription regulator [Tepidanaerobacter syntrophicus]GAQ24925.1 DeoR family transcriptional regulator, fructose operon transcriptional repressor [Tepidanaerobacter syntrophicus]
MFAEERQQKILELLEKNSSIKVKELAKMFDVSESTIRRDLQEMEEKQLLKRTHGGAVGIKKMIFEPTFKEKEDKSQREKSIIAKTAASLIEDNDTIILDSGTTTLEIARCLEAKDITVITNSIDIASELSERDDVELVITGGSLRKKTRAMVGHIAESTIRNFRVDKAFIGANGISVKEGITTPNFIEAQTKRAMMEVADKVYIVADASKFNQVCFSVISSIREVTAIITSGDLDEEVIKEFEDAGGKIIIKNE